MTENCLFWEKVGACRHGNKCAKYHKRPSRSNTIVFWKIFSNPVKTLYKKAANADDAKETSDFVSLDVDIDEAALQREAERLYQDLFVELALKYGEIEAILICGNYNLHLGGNVLVKFKDERSASKCYMDCNDRWYNEKPIFCEFSPVNNMDNTVCKEYSARRKCERGDQCNLIHARRPSPELERSLFASQRAHFRGRAI